MPAIHIGTSGWMYRSWREHLYAGVPAKRWLAHAAATFGALEINGSFYTQIRESTYARWREQTPADFRFALKGHRFLTHYKRLRECEASIALQRAPTLALGEKLVAVVWQLPASFRVDVERLHGFLHALERWPEVRHALELRHASWFTTEVATMLERARVAACLSDAPDFPMWDVVTTDLVYVRLHGHTRKYASSYRTDHLARWAERIRSWSNAGLDVHCYLDNDAEGAAVANASTLRALVDARRAAPKRARRSSAA
jgi:uncharacterized protein YecE (DUF72 family)